MLRLATRDAHAVVDSAFGHFDLGQPDSYLAFLTAHARIIPAVEAWLDEHQPAAMQGWRSVRRTPGLLADLAALGAQAPTALPFSMDDDLAAVCGVTYVIEGSRLGGALLARSVAPGLPTAYLGAPSQSALWREFAASLDAHLPTIEARDRAGQAALATFDLFRAAGEQAAYA